MKLYILSICLLAHFSLSNEDENLQRKIISDSEFNYTFYVSINEISKYDYSKYYFWYKSGEIHSSQGSSSGDLLHGSYTKSYKDNALAEQGIHKKGLKNKTWKRWYRNGQLYEISSWKKGFREGKYFQFSEEGETLIQGSYKNNNKHGIWVNHSTNDTLYFKKGIKVEKLKKHAKKSLKQRVKNFFKNIFTKKEKGDLENRTNPKQKKRRVKKKKNKSNL